MKTVARCLGKGDIDHETAGECFSFHSNRSLKLVELDLLDFPRLGAPAMCATSWELGSFFW